MSRVIQTTVDDQLGHELQMKAENLGLSLSSYVRATLKTSLNQKSLVEQGLDDVKNGRVEEVSLEEFKKELRALR